MIPKTLLNLGAMCIFFLVVLPANAQDKDGMKREFKFGKVQPSEFALIPFAADTGATGLTLFDVGSCDFRLDNNGFVYVFERHVRYKVLNKNGLDLGNLEVPVFKGSSSSGKERISSMQGATYNLVGDKVVVTKPKKDAEFSETFDKDFVLRKMALPNVKEGSIVEFFYRIESDLIFTLRGWRFQSDLPALWSEYTVSIPEFFQYKVNLNGEELVKRGPTTTVNATYVPGVSSMAQNTRFVAENIPALKDEPFVTTLDDYRAQVEFELQGTHFPNDMYRDYTGTWPKIIQALKADENFGKYMAKRGYIRSLTPDLLRLNDGDTLAAVERIYHFVQSQVKWDKSYWRYTTYTNPKQLFEKKTGNSADINLALVGLLQEAGISAYPVLVSTRSNGAHPGYPIISKFNNVVALALVGDTSYLLDATDLDLPMGMLTFSNLSRQGFLCDLAHEEGQWISTSPTFSGESRYNYILSLEEDNTLHGKLVYSTLGYEGWRRRSGYRLFNGDTDYIKDYCEDKPGLTVSSCSFKNLDTLNLPFIESMDIVIEDHVEESGDLVYFSPLLFERTKENPFKHEARNFPVDMGYPMKETYRMLVNFPENYAVEQLPKGVLYVLPEERGSFRISLIGEGKQLLVMSTISLTKPVYTPEEYHELRELFKIVVERQAEQIVFKKN
ncbi:hypothetical protein GCM10007415_00140 [Parapedobacter pyrenivorans]|uniref:DUF3857 domain-containing protein n=1 Tax=Parapedobacter pyrenivorans TaxID=1305674 RepID=A0A917HAP3_9SPHI|nr:DUF3858 domain-containing protein [Parapedobacter pyrenivorans]GGG72830.1 hypothetical protein GCM10007415_00140 [Parapedobacter pyrenivorans]